MLFSRFGLTVERQRTLSAQGYVKSSPIQAQGIPVSLEGRDAFAGAQTGTGRTAAYSLPMLQLLCRASISWCFRQRPSSREWRALRLGSGNTSRASLVTERRAPENPIPAGTRPPVPLWPPHSGGDLR